MMHEKTLYRAVDTLAGRHREIRAIVSTYGNPPLWGREPGFCSLVYTILEQQVSLASARAVYRKLQAKTGGLSPEKFLRLSDDELRSIGFSRQKIAYCRNVASLILENELDLAALEEQTDQDAQTVLMGIKGIGRWTAEIYLLHSLGRPDIWPASDLALQIGYQEALNLPQRPDENELDRFGVQYAPWRSAAARVFWHFYIEKRNLKLA